MLHPETQKQSLKTWLTPQQQQEIRLWLLSGGREWKNHESILYSWYNPSNPKENGYRSFLEFSQNPEYKKYFSRVEAEWMQMHQHTVRKWLHTWFLGNSIKQLVELWPWNEKIENYLSYFWFPPKVLKKLKYRPADVAQSWIESGMAGAEDAGLELWNPLLGSWDKPWAFEWVEDPLYVSFGGWFVNGLWGVTERIANLRSNSLVNWGKLLFTYASLQDENIREDEILKLKALYGNLISNKKPNPYKNKEICKKALTMVMKPFEALWFPMDCLKYSVEWQSWEIVLWATVIKEFTMSEWDETFAKSIGDFIPLIDSPRPDEETIKWLVKSWWGKINILSYEHMRYALVDLPKKKVTENQMYFALALTGLLWISSTMYFLGRDIENMHRKKAQEQQSQELKLTLWCSNDIYFNQLLDKILNDLEERYWNHLTQDQKILLTGKVLDFFSSHQTLFAYGYVGWQVMMYYSTDLYTPTMMDMFIAENNNLLLSMRLNIIPNNQLLANPEALMNSYYYQGERQEFSKVDKNLPDYVSEWVSEWAWVYGDGKPFYFTYPCGIKYIDWKPYFVVKRAGANWYMLEEKTPNLRSSWWLCSGDIVTEILARWQVQIFAERIPDFLVLRYGDKMVASMNWQDVIAAYLIDLYAQWRDLEFLFWTTKDIADQYWYLRDSPLHNFVLTYVIPAIGDRLVYGVDWDYRSSKMYDLDMEKIAVDQQKVVNLSIVLPEVYDFMNAYIPKRIDDIQEGKVKSIIMKNLLLDPAVAKLDITDNQSIRARLTIHAQQFKDDWIGVPDFPDWVDTFLSAKSWPTYSASDNLQGISWKDAHAWWWYEQMQFWWFYTDISWNEYDLWVYSTGFLKSIVVARINNKSSDTDLIRRWKEGEFGLISYGHPRARMVITEQSNSVLLDKLRGIAITYSSKDVHALVADYKQRKKAMKTFE